MTVREVLALLEGCDPDATVVVAQIYYRPIIEDDDVWFPTVEGIRVVAEDLVLPRRYPEDPDVALEAPAVILEVEPMVLIA
jgi:hypothetical protein